MAEVEANDWTRRVVSVVKRSCGDDFAFKSVRVIEIKDLLGSHLSSKSSAPGESMLFLPLSLELLVKCQNLFRGLFNDCAVNCCTLHPGTGTDSDHVTRLTTYCREHAPSLANVVSTTPVRPPGTLCHLTYMTLLTLAYSRNDLKLFCLIVRTDLLLLLYGTPGRFVERHLTNLSLYCIVLY